MQVATMTIGPLILPVPCYLIQTGDGKNILVDSGLPRNISQPEITEEMKEDSLRRTLSIRHGKNVTDQLAMIGLQPSDIDILVCTHYDDDHAGNISAFPHALIVVQRLQHEVAQAGHPRFAHIRSQWDQPISRFLLIDGDTELLPGLELIETSGHVPGHQVVLVHLPHTGAVLLTIDAVAVEAHFKADRATGPTDEDGVEAIASTRKLLALVESEHVSLVIFGHDALQWSKLKQLPDFFD